MEVTIVYDNTRISSEYRADWGFSCYIKFNNRDILFDTGAKGRILTANLHKLNLHPEEIDDIFISHDHWDHSGGLASILDHNSDVNLYYPPSLSMNLDDYPDLNTTPIQKPSEIFPGLYTSGMITGGMNEQSIALVTQKGVIIITGCAHPGVTKIVRHFHEKLSQEILLVFGGFHLADYSLRDINTIIENFKEMGVRYAGPTHCTGRKAIEAFEEKYKQRYLDLGAGKTFTLNDITD